jgi:hypothetical protein
VPVYFLKVRHGYTVRKIVKDKSSYSITNLGQGSLFRSQQSRRLVASSVVVQVVVFLLDDNLELVWEPVVFHSLNVSEPIVSFEVHNCLLGCTAV